MAKKLKKSVGLGSQMAPPGNGPFTEGFQSKRDFFGPSLVLTHLTALETPTNLWKHLAICQYLTQDTKSTKINPFGGFILAIGTTSINWRNGVKNWIFAVQPLVFDQSPLPKKCSWMKFKGTSGKLRSRPFIWYLEVDTVTTGEREKFWKRSKKSVFLPSPITDYGHSKS